MGILRTSFITFLTIAAVSAGTILNGTNAEPSFKAEPRGRGTFGLVTNCLATYFLCVWTAIHPDIIPNPSVTRTSLYKITLLVISVFMPESTILPAYAQRREAKQIRKAWCAKFGIEKGDPHDIGDEGGFLVMMGGVSVGEQDALGKSRSILTPLGFKRYLEDGHIQKTDLLKDTITDKGKASLVVKLLVFFQACWFVAGCIGRVWKGLPITLLEIHVCIQVVGAFTAYCFWISKPLDIDHPIHLNIPIHLDVATHLEVSSWKEGTPVPETTTYPKDLYFITEDARPSLVTVILRAVSSTGEFVLDHTNYNLYGVGCLIALNGACHSLAYLGQFPNKPAQWVWMTSSVSLCVVPFIVGYLLRSRRYIDSYYHLTWRQRFTNRKNEFTHVFEIIWTIVVEIFVICSGPDKFLSLSWIVKMPPRLFLFGLTFFLIAWYVVSVFVIMVVCVVSLWNLELGSYSTPVWSNYGPQIS